ncbi:MAG: asparagine synthase (glutamine-hydrolyzing) [Chitinophagaceae bacterium]
MCGIAGIVSPYSSSIQQPRLQKMANVLQHRGPDGEGFWMNENRNVGFAFRRLSIIDLSKNADQPFHYLHYTIIFNGEIYNYIELKNELKKQGYIFKTHTDTEVIPAAYDFWKKDCLHHFDGMFAFALWNEKNNELFIARDRFGEKPLYYHIDKNEGEKFGQFLFASEMKALWNAGVPKLLNGKMMLNYLTLGYVQNPQNKGETFYKDILSLPPSHYLLIQPMHGKLLIKKWYDLKSEIQNPKFEITKSESEIIETFNLLFISSVTKRLRSDVSIGTSLSGGIDSSSIVAAIFQLKQKISINPQWKNVGFTAIFPGFEKDESIFSEIVAKQFDIQQYTITPTANDWIKYFDEVIYYQEEPLQSSSVLTQFLVYKSAKEKNIIVLLDGQGADEILGGYKKYSHWYLQQLLRNNISIFLKEKKLLQQNNFLESWDFKNYAAAFFPKIAAKELQRQLIKKYKNNSFINDDFFREYSNKESLQKPAIRKLNDILYYNSFQLGLEELLRYADRNSMAHSREVRLPFLNHELVEFIFRLPSSFKIKNGFTKWILRQSMRSFLPAKIVWSKDKIGYEPPQKQWMQNKQIQEMIFSAREKMINEKIIDNSIKKTPIKTSAAHDADNFDWRCLSAAAMV